MGPTFAQDRHGQDFSDLAGQVVDPWSECLACLGATQSDDFRSRVVQHSSLERQCTELCADRIGDVVGKHFDSLGTDAQEERDRGRSEKLKKRCAQCPA
ncbi:hypothetical protein HRbin27_00744 [bacterium HR27]|nr:hypothetical protein HRbin27_00744 [bacterium HR27]